MSEGRLCNYGMPVTEYVTPCQQPAIENFQGRWYCLAHIVLAQHESYGARLTAEYTAEQLGLTKCEYCGSKITSKTVVPTTYRMGDGASHQFCSPRCLNHWLDQWNRTSIDAVADRAIPFRLSITILVTADRLIEVGEPGAMTTYSPADTEKVGQTIAILLREALK